MWVWRHTDGLEDPNLVKGHFCVILKIFHSKESPSIFRSHLVFRCNAFPCGKSLKHWTFFFLNSMKNFLQEGIRITFPRKFTMVWNSNIAQMQQRRLMGLLWDVDEENFILTVQWKKNVWSGWLNLDHTDLFSTFLGTLSTVLLIDVDSNGEDWMIHLI